MKEYKGYESDLLMQNSLGSLSPNSIRLFPTDSTKQLSLARPQDLRDLLNLLRNQKGQIMIVHIALILQKI